MQLNCALITVVIHTSLLKKLLAHLDDLGVNHLYSSYGRSIVLSDVGGLFSLFGASDLYNEPVEVLYFYTSLEFETQIIKSVVSVCRLDIPGRGSVFSKHLRYFSGETQNFLSSFNKEKLHSSPDVESVTVFNNLTQILCTMSKGLADDVARLLLHMGIVPVITNASGTGLRDQLGLLRITIPKEKELLSVVVGHHEANGVMDRIIHWGKLDRPGRGFVWQMPVSHGLINFKTSRRAIGQAASTEQIIAAIDSLKGNFSWRQGGSTLSAKTRRDYYKGIEFFIQVAEGGSLDISKAMLKLGISGATVQSLKTILEKADEDNIIIPQEIVRVVVSEEQSKKVIEKLNASEFSFLTESKANVFSAVVNKAFNYKSPTS